MHETRANFGPKPRLMKWGYKGLANPDLRSNDLGSQYTPQLWAGSYELRVNKRDEFISPTMPKCYADYDYDH